MNAIELTEKQFNLINKYVKLTIGFIDDASVFQPTIGIYQEEISGQDTNNRPTKYLQKSAKITFRRPERMTFDEVEHLFEVEKKDNAELTLPDKNHLTIYVRL